MASKPKNTASIELSDDLLESASSVANNYPSNASEQIEQWAYLGKAVSRQLTEFEQLQLMSGEYEVILRKKA